MIKSLCAEYLEGCRQYEKNRYFNKYIGLNAILKLPNADFSDRLLCFLSKKKDFVKITFSKDFQSDDFYYNKHFDILLSSPYNEICKDICRRTDDNLSKFIIKDQGYDLDLGEDQDEKLEKQIENCSKIAILTNCSFGSFDSSLDFTHERSFDHEMLLQRFLVEFYDFHSEDVLELNNLIGSTIVQAKAIFESKEDYGKELVREIFEISQDSYEIDELSSFLFDQNINHDLDKVFDEFLDFYRAYNADKNNLGIKSKDRINIVVHLIKSVEILFSILAKKKFNNQKLYYENNKGELEEIRLAQDQDTIGSLILIFDSNNSDVIKFKRRHLFEYKNIRGDFYDFKKLYRNGHLHKDLMLAKKMKQSIIGTVKALKGLLYFFKNL